MNLKLNRDPFKNVKYIFFVESPSKIKIFKNIFKEECEAFFTKGHINKLSVVNMGFDRSNFKENYELMDSVKKFKWFKYFEILSSKHKSKIILATDNDREGELIAYHLNLFFKIDLKTKNRMKFNELSENIILSSIKNLATIDMNLVAAQQGRRIMDRYIGFSFSPLLNKLFYSQQSAGRVQSIVLKFINDKYQKFISSKNKYYYRINLLIKEKKIEFFIYSKEKFNELKICESEIKNIKDNYNNNNFYFKIINNEIKQKKISSLKPFITSTLQRFAFSYLKIKPDYCMRLLQNLYEGDFSKLGIKGGLITYPRTDSYRFSKLFYDDVVIYIKNNFGNNFIKKFDNKTKKDIFTQDAHECIRPTSLNNKPEDLKDFFVDHNSYLLYSMIYYRMIASNMKDSICKRNIITIKTLDNKFNFIKEIIFYDNDCVKGFLACPHLYIYNLKNYIDNYQLVLLFKSKTSIKPFEISFNKSVNKLLKLFNFGTIIKELSDKKIGRPSTYASFVPKLIYRKYILENKKKQLITTPLGENVLYLLNLFSIKNLLNENLTALIESQLDKIEKGELSKNIFLNKNLDIFKKDIDLFKDYINFFNNYKFSIYTDCLKCKKRDKMYLQSGFFGIYYSCSICKNNFPCFNSELSKKVKIRENIIYFND